MDEDNKTIDIDSLFGELNSVKSIAESAILKAETNLGFIEEQKSSIEENKLSLRGIKLEIKGIQDFIKFKKDEEEDRLLEEEDARQKQEMADRAKGLGGGQGDGQGDGQGGTGLKDGDSPQSGGLGDALKGLIGGPIGLAIMGIAGVVKGFKKFGSDVKKFGSGIKKFFGGGKGLGSEDKGSGSGILGKISSDPNEMLNIPDDLDESEEKKKNDESKKKNDESKKKKNEEFDEAKKKSRGGPDRSGTQDPNAEKAKYKGGPDRSGTQGRKDNIEKQEVEPEKPKKLKLYADYIREGATIESYAKGDFEILYPNGRRQLISSTGKGGRGNTVEEQFNDYVKTSAAQDEEKRKREEKSKKERLEFGKKMYESFPDKYNPDGTRKETKETKKKKKNIFGFNQGGEVEDNDSDTSNNDEDSVPSLLTPGEFVIKKESVKKIGVDTLHGINAAAEKGNVFEGLSKEFDMSAFETKQKSIGGMDMALTETKDGKTTKRYMTATETRKFLKDQGIPAKELINGMVIPDFAKVAAAEVPKAYEIASRAIRENVPENYKEPMIAELDKFMQKLVGSGGDFRDTSDIEAEMNRYIPGTIENLGEQITQSARKSKPQKFSEGGLVESLQGRKFTGKRLFNLLEKSDLGKAVQSEEVPKFLEGMAKGFGGLINPEDIKNTVVGKVKERGMGLAEPMMEKIDKQFGEILSLMGAADLPDDEMPPPPKPQRSPNGSSIMRQASSPQVSSTPIRSSESTVPFINLMQQESRKQLNIVKQGQSNLPLEVINFINKIK